MKSSLLRRDFLTKLAPLAFAMDLSAADDIRWGQTDNNLRVGLGVQRQNKEWNFKVLFNASVSMQIIVIETARFLHSFQVRAVDREGHELLLRQAGAADQGHLVPVGLMYQYVAKLPGGGTWEINWPDREYVAMTDSSVSAGTLLDKGYGIYVSYDVPLREKASYQHEYPALWWGEIKSGMVRAAK